MIRHEDMDTYPSFYNVEYQVSARHLHPNQDFN
jgi:hypothetical protein